MPAFTFKYLFIQSGQTACSSSDLPRTGGASRADTGEAEDHCSEVTQERNAQPSEEITGGISKSISVQLERQRVYAILNDLIAKARGSKDKEEPSYRAHAALVNTTKRYKHY